MMRKITLILSLLVISIVCKSQSVTTNPGVFTAEDEVTLIIDVTGTSLEGHTGDVWIWAWISSGCSGECNAPTNINPAGSEDTNAAKVTRDASNPNIYTFTMVPIDFYGKTPAEIQTIGLKLKSQDWGDNKQTDNDLLIDIQPLIFVANENRNFPVKFTANDLVTFYYDQSLATNDDMAGLSDLYAHLFYSVRKPDGSIIENINYTDWNDVGTTPELLTTSRGNGIFSLSIIPNEFFTLEAGDEIIKISYIFRDTSGSIQASGAESFPLTLD